MECTSLDPSLPLATHMMRFFFTRKAHTKFITFAVEIKSSENVISTRFPWVSEYLWGIRAWRQRRCACNELHFAHRVIFSHSRLPICFCLFKKQTALSSDNINTDGELKFNGKYKQTEERFEMPANLRFHATTVEI